MLVRSYNKLFTINWVYLLILENTMSSFSSMALASLTQPYRNIMFPISYVLSNLVNTSNYNLPVLFLVWGLLK